ncbi:MAG TPA: hypothetical protein VNM91_00330 [Dehalococcoidia bacterium]|nr:hypothetical protein [Dehalococcoidia bacterium]
MTKARKVPRPFEMPWARGQIIEEAAYTGPHHDACIQLMRYDDGDAAGTLAVRFCSYDHSGRFQRNPLIVSEATIAGLRVALNSAPRLRTLLRKLVV